MAEQRPITDEILEFLTEHPIPGPGADDSGPLPAEIRQWGRKALSSIRNRSEIKTETSGEVKKACPVGQDLLKP